VTDPGGQARRDPNGRKQMEPIERDQRVCGVQQPDITGVPATSLQLVVEPLERLSFHDFYSASRDHVGRGLAVTLGDPDLAADAVDEAMTRAYQRWSSVREMENPAGWVYRVGLNVARSRIRRLTRRRTAHHQTTDVPEPTVIEPTILRALRELPIDHRSVVVCRLLLGWSEAETATALGIRPGTVKSRLHRATSTLAHQLAHLRPEATS
jgi:RNA polymerase sigma-70 factor (ECF subfamily)